MLCNCEPVDASVYFDDWQTYAPEKKEVQFLLYSLFAPPHKVTKLLYIFLNDWDFDLNCPLVKCLPLCPACAKACDCILYIFIILAHLANDTTICEWLL